MKTCVEAFGALIDILNELDSKYMVVGSFASNLYGIPRSTQDGDVVVDLEKTTISDIAKRMKPEFKLDDQITIETATMTTRFVFESSILPFKFEIFALSDQQYDRSRFERRQELSAYGRRIFFLSPEDVVVTKLLWVHRLGRNKDKDDLEGVLSVSSDIMDWPYIHHWCDQHGTRELLDEIRESLPEL